MSIFIILYCVKVNVSSTVIGIQERRPSMDMTKFEFVLQDLYSSLTMQSKSGYKFTNLMHNLLIISLITICRTDSGIFVLKFMQLWSNSGLSRAIENDKVIKYRAKLLTQLIMSSKNEIKENVYQAMDQ
ncbi:hypothetical protein PVL29_009663 [Vitis rotundifolia]|uniref:Uncharacterized protein n=1 Tax=Vitis rotundifolia TaxID=103349 RepID=A0AA39DRT6_VITRO|nr:hypothetical protein PVL29_009663 [Vitis rotundifolia]